jgi:hypothetical protein
VEAAKKKRRKGKKGKNPEAGGTARAEMITAYYDG